MAQEDAGPEDGKEPPTLFDRVWAFVLVYPELITVLVLVVIAVAIATFSG